MKNKAVVVKQDEQQPIAAEVIAQSIVKISDATKALLSAGLRYETIVALVHDRSGVAKSTIRIVINNLESLRENWTTR